MAFLPNNMLTTDSSISVVLTKINECLKDIQILFEEVKTSRSEGKSEIEIVVETQKKSLTNLQEMIR